MLLGQFTYSQMQEFSRQPQYAWLAPAFAPLKPVEAGCQKLQALVFFGSWCGDTLENLPAFVETWRRQGGLPDSLTFIGLDRTKRMPLEQGALAERYEVQRLPTFVILGGANELGRIVESPAQSMDADLRQIWL